MKKKNSKNIRKTNKILVIITGVFVCYTVFTLIDTQFQINEKEKSIEALEEEIASKEQIRAELEAELSAGATNEAISRVAKEKLGLASPGERIIVDIGSK